MGTLSIDEIRQVLIGLSSQTITIARTISFLDEKQRVVIEHLKNWKHHQHLAMYGDRAFVENGVLILCRNEQDLKNAQKIHSEKLDEIQTWFDGLVSIIWETMKLIHNGPDFTAENETISEILKSLLRLSLIVQEQPPQVNKANRKFNTKVRLLLSKFIEPGALAIPPAELKSFNVSIISKKGVCGNVKNAEKGSQGWVKQAMTNGMGQHVENFTYNLQNVQIPKVERSATKDEEKVMDELFAMQFQLDLQIFGYQVSISTTSSPFVFIVSGKQESQAWATIIWDSAFFTVNRTPFKFDKSIQWPEMANELRKRFRAQAGCELTDDNLSYLCEKVFQNQIPQSGVLTWKQFAKIDFGCRLKTFSFGKWFYDVMILTKNHLSGEWKAGLIVGFISKDKAKETIQNCSIGTFLLRFSDSACGCITVAYVDKDGKVDNLQPFFHENFKNPKQPTDAPNENRKPHTIGHLVKHLSCLTHLYLDMEKNHAFGAFYTQISDRDPNGYKRLTQATAEAPGDERVGNGYKQTDNSMALSTSPGSESTANASANPQLQLPLTMDEAQPSVSGSNDDFSGDDIEMEGAAAQDIYINNFNIEYFDK